jgi:hypothetical protein
MAQALAKTLNISQVVHGQMAQVRRSTLVHAQAPFMCPTGKLGT